MITFNDFINEGVTDYLEGKSEDDMMDILKGMKDIDKIKTIEKYKLPIKLMPEKYNTIKNNLIKYIKRKLTNYKHDEIMFKEDLELKLYEFPLLKRDNEENEHMITTLFENDVKVAIVTWFDNDFDVLDYYNVPYDKLTVTALLKLQDILSKNSSKLNEGISDYLQPKSEEEIDRQINSMPLPKKIVFVYDNNLDKEKYLPENINGIKRVFIYQIKDRLNHIVGNYKVVIIPYKKENNGTEYFIDEIDRNGVTIYKYKYHVNGGWRKKESMYLSYDSLDIYHLAKIMSILDFDNTNESVKNILQPKSEDEIEDAIDKISKLDIIKQLDTIRRYKLGQRYMPSDDKIKDELSKLDTIGKINMIDRYNLDKKFMPSDSEIHKLPIMNKLHLINLDMIPKYFLPSKEELGNLLRYNIARGVKEDALNVVKKYVYKYPMDAGFFVNFIYKLNSYGEYRKYLIDVVGDHIHDLIEDGNIDVDSFDGMTDEDMINQYLDDDAKIEFIGQSKYYTSVDIFKNFVTDLRKTSWGEARINEGVKDILRPKSGEEMKIAIDNIDNIDERIKKIIKMGLPKEWLPPKEDMLKYVRKMSIEDRYKFVVDNKLDSSLLPNRNEIEAWLSNKNNNEIINNVLKFKMPYKFLPRNTDGICYCSTSLMIQNMGIDMLPENLTVNGNFSVANNKLTELPKGLRVNGHFLCNGNQLTSLPDDLYVERNIYCYDNAVVLKEPSTATIKGKFKDI